jgi:thiamine biosynthesis lipoprotein
MRTTRRRFLCAALGSGGALALIYRGGPIDRVLPEDSLQSFTHHARALGAEVSITALHARRQAAERAVQAAFAELELVEELMSIYRPHSQLSRLNRAGRLDDPHPNFVEVLRAAREISQDSEGAFDITVQPLWALYDSTHKAGRLPTAAEIAAARGRVDWRHVEITPQSIRLHGEGTAITLNGIAQGYAADRALAALQEHGVEHALVNAGEIGSLGRRADGDAWTVGIQHPRQEDAYIALAKLEGRALSTSGDYATTFSDDFRHHHVFDPRTGASPTQFQSVSVAAPTAMAADALSTAIFVAGLERGMKLIESTPGADAFFVLKDGRTLATKGFPLDA